MSARRGVALVGVLLAASAVTACSPRHSPHHPQGSPSAPATSPAGSATTSTPATPPAAPTLRLGQSITVDWTPPTGRAGRITLRVTGIERADWSYFADWQVPQSTKAARWPFFVRATVANVGSTDLGGHPVPLYVQDKANQLVAASTFGSASGSQSFTPCHPDRLPARFPHGSSIKSCLVMLVPRHSPVVGVTYLPRESDQPITWHGAVTRAVRRGHHS